MLNTQFIKSMTDLRLDPAKITKLASESSQPVYIFNRSRPVSVVLDIQLYEDMMKKLQDYEDTAILEKSIKKNEEFDDFGSFDRKIRKKFKTKKSGK